MSREQLLTWYSPDEKLPEINDTVLINDFYPGKREKLGWMSLESAPILMKLKDGRIASGNYSFSFYARGCQPVVDCGCSFDRQKKSSHRTYERDKVVEWAYV